MELEAVESQQVEVTHKVWGNTDTSSDSQLLLLHRSLQCPLQVHTLHTRCWGCCRNGTGQKMWRSQPTASWIFTLASNWVRHTHTTVLLSLHTLYGLCSHTCAAVTGHVITWNTLCTVCSHIGSYSTTWRVWEEGAELLTVDSKLRRNSWQTANQSVINQCNHAEVVQLKYMRHLPNTWKTLAG